MSNAAARKAALARALANEVTPSTSTPGASITPSFAPQPIASSSNSASSSSTPREHPDWSRARDDPRIKELRASIDMLPKGKVRQNRERTLRFATLMVLNEMGSSELAQAAVSMVLNCPGSVDTTSHPLYEMRQMIPLAVHDQNWQVLLMFCWKDIPFPQTHLGLAPVFGDSPLHTLKYWIGDQTSKDVPPSIPPDLLFSLYDLNELLIKDPKSHKILNRGPSMGKFSQAKSDKGTAPTNSSDYSKFKPIRQTQSITSNCLVEQINAYSVKNPGSLTKLLDGKGILAELGVSLESNPSIPVVGDLEVKVNVSEKESDGVNNISLISSNETCVVVKNVDSRYDMFYQKKSGPLFHKTGEVELIVLAAEFLTDKAKFLLDFFNNSRIDERALWDAGRAGDQLFSVSRPRFATQKAVTTLRMIDSTGESMSLRCRNFGGTLQSLQRMLGHSWWNLRDLQSHWFSTPSNPTRTKLVDIIDRSYPLTVTLAARSVAEHPARVGKSYGDTVGTQEIIFSLTQLAVMDLKRCNGSFEKQLPKEVKLAPLPDDSTSAENKPTMDDLNDGDRWDSAVDIVERGGDDSKGKGKDKDKNKDKDKGKGKEEKGVSSGLERYDVELAKSRRNSWTPDQLRWLWAIFVSKYGVDAVAKAYGMNKTELETYIVGIEVSLSKLMTHLVETGQTAASIASSKYSEVSVPRLPASSTPSGSLPMADTTLLTASTRSSRAAPTAPLNLPTPVLVDSAQATLSAPALSDRLLDQVFEYLENILSAASWEQAYQALVLPSTRRQIAKLVQENPEKAVAATVDYFSSMVLE
ncbi:hypothetical protein JCM5353_000417 [Sporobolomyces roseus]